jgi:hypothetical protein
LAGLLWKRTTLEPLDFGWLALLLSLTELAAGCFFEVFESAILSKSEEGRLMVNFDRVEARR